MSISELTRFLNSKNCKLVPCSEGEINFLEEHYGIHFPLVYKEFLQSMGKGAGDYMKGSSAFYNELIEINEEANNLLIEDGLLPLPKNTFVFWMHQGYQFAFFYLTEISNPPVFFYYEGKRKIEKVENSLTEFLQSQLLFSELK